MFFEPYIVGSVQRYNVIKNKEFKGESFTVTKPTVFECCTFDACTFKDSTADCILFIHCSITQSLFTCHSVGGTRFHYCDMYGVHIDRWASGHGSGLHIVSCDFGGRITNSVLCGRVAFSVFRDTEFRACDLTNFQWLYNPGNDVQFNRCAIDFNDRDIIIQILECMKVMHRSDSFFADDEPDDDFYTRISKILGVALFENNLCYPGLYQQIKDDAEVCDFIRQALKPFVACAHHVPDFVRQFINNEAPEV